LIMAVFFIRTCLIRLVYGRFKIEDCLGILAVVIYFAHSNFAIYLLMLRGWLVTGPHNGALHNPQIKRMPFIHKENNSKRQNELETNPSEVL
jgi:hypothetical protein